MNRRRCSGKELMSVTGVFPSAGNREVLEALKQMGGCCIA